jgi:AraC family transcriptional regulator of adaptative response/methylated-DNA-[protein]-cysteine methyltransferase
MNDEPLLPADEDALWQAVTARDAAQDGAFVFAVRSTGIYCRPSCPARRPHREQVTFYPTPQAAEAAGYRPCKRCRPHEDPAAREAELVQRACRLLEETPDSPPGLAELSRALGVSASHLQKVFKKHSGVSPRQFAAGLRLQRFKEGVQAGEDVTGALYGAGYGSSSRLYEQARQHLGMTPAAYRRGGQGMHIHYTIVDSPLDRMLAAATQHGLCAVYFGSRDDELEAALREEYPAAHLQKDGEALQSWVRAILEHLAGSRPQLDLPQDVPASAFRLQVWQALRQIPRGETRTYSQVAEAIGQPAAVRAVAHACAANPVSVVNPCHRVLRRDGELGGYRWGLERKQALLEMEQEKQV